MEGKIIFWIVVLVIYFLSRLKKKSQPPEYQNQERKEPFNPTQPASFEELLKQIQSTKDKQTKPELKSVPAINPVSKSKKDYVLDYDDQIEPEIPDLEPVDFDHREKDSIYQIYENAKSTAFQHPSMEDTLKLEDTVVKFGQFKEYQNKEETSLARLIGAEFENKEALKKAFIMNEILSRRF